VADNGISKEEMSELFAKFFGEGKATGAIKFDEKDLTKFKDQIKQTTDALKKSTPSFSGAWETFVAGSKETRDELKRFDESIKKIRETTNGAERDQKEQALQSQKIQYAQAAAHKQLATSIVGAAGAFGGIIGDMAQASMDFVKGLQSGASGVEIGTQAAKSTATAGLKTAGAIAQLGDGVSSVVMLMGPWGMAIGVLMKVISGFVSWFAKDAQKLTEQALQGLGDELKKTQKGFKDITGAGAVMGGGMTEMRQQAARAGLDIEQLATVVRESKDDLANMGLGLGEATKRVAGVSKELRNSEFGTQLQKLGYSFEEQVGLSAQVMANQRASGDIRVKSDKEIAATTASYGRDLKILSDITGQDAKKAMEKARMQAMEADLLAQAYEKGGPEAVEKLRNQLATLPEGLKKGYMEYVSTGGTAIADVATNIAMTNNPKIKQTYDTMLGTLGDRNKSEHDALIEAGKLSEETVDYAMKNKDAYMEMGTAARLVGSETSKGAVDIQNSMTADYLKRKMGATKKADEESKKMSENMAPLDVAVTTLEANTQKLKAALGEQLTGPITGFANSLVKGMDTIDDALEQFGIVTDRQKAKKAAAKMPAMVGGGSAPGMAVTGEVDLSGGGGSADNTPPEAPKASPKQKATMPAGGTAPTIPSTLSTNGRQGSGPITGALQAKLDLIGKAFPGAKITSLNDSDLVDRSNSKHGSGEAIDLVVAGMKDNSSQYVSQLTAMGFPTAQFEQKGQKNANGSVATGDHLHAQLNTGGIVGANPGGKNFKLGEGGRDELVTPLINGMLPGMEDLIAAVNRLVDISRDHQSTSEKILYATA